MNQEERMEILKAAKSVYCAHVRSGKLSTDIVTNRAEEILNLTFSDYLEDLKSEEQE